MNKQLQWIIGIGGGIMVLLTIFVVLFMGISQSNLRYKTNAFTGRKQWIALSIDQQLAYGNAATDDWENEEETPNTQRVNRIGKKLLNGSSLTNSEFDIKFFVIRDTNEMLNAFARVGGHTYITRSLLDSCKSDDEVAFVLAHETAHVLGQHAAESWTKAMLLKQIFTFEEDNIASVLGSKVVDLTELSFSRSQETEADFFAVQLMIKAGFDPTAALDSFDFFESLGKRPNALFSDHPNLTTRRQTIKKAMEAFKSDSP